MKKIIIYAGLVIFLMACKDNKENKADSSETLPAENVTETSEWVYLFDGTSTDGWRGYGSDKLPEAWVIEDGMLKSLGKGGDIGGDIVYGKENFSEFELSLEWKISDGGNSGIFYHIVEDEKYAAPYYTAPEYQLIDQIGFPEKLETWQSIGADYGMYDPDMEGVVKPAGEWNTSRILFTKEKAEYWLNGKMTASFVPWSDDWNKRKNEGKWKDYPDYGIAETGLIGLQDHGSFIWFKNIKIRKL